MTLSPEDFVVFFRFALILLGLVIVLKTLALVVLDHRVVPATLDHDVDVPEHKAPWKHIAIRLLVGLGLMGTHFIP